MSLLAGINPSYKIANVRVSNEGELYVANLSAEGENNGTVVFTAVDDNYLVTTTAMKVGAYTVAAQPKGSHVVTVKSSAVGTADTQGTVVVVGKDSDGKVITETLTPVAGSTVTGSLGFEEITSITGAGWVIDVGAGNDTIIVGVGAIKPPTGKYIFAIAPVTDTVLAANTFVSGSLGPDLTGLTALVAGQVYYGRWATITLTSGEAIAYYKKL
jgi:hypothetical protein